MKNFSIILIISVIPFLLFGRISVIGGLTQNIQMNDGETKSGTITIRNDGVNLEEIKVYLTDYSFSHDGTSEYSEVGTNTRSIAEYITFNPHKATIPPNSSINVNYTIVVPKNTADMQFTGSLWSVFMVESIPENSPESETFEPDTDYKMSIGINLRFAVQIIVNFGETGERKLEFLNAKIQKLEDKRILAVDVKNSGERHFRPNLIVELYDEVGIFIDKFTADKKHIYPNTSVRYLVDLTYVKSGKYKALVIADGGNENLFGINYNIELKK